MNRIESISSEQYHAADGISNSMLKWIRAPKTPAHFKAKYIDRLIPDEETKALLIGSLTHRQIFEPETMDGAFHVSPSTLWIQTARVAKLKSAIPVMKDGIPVTDGDNSLVEWNASFTEAKDWNRDHSDRPIISANDSAMILGIRDSVLSHPIASRIIKCAEFERSVFAEKDGLLLKSRFDILPRTGNIIADLKTCESADLNSVEKAMASYEYYIQAAFYLQVANLLGLNRSAFVFIFVEKSPPYAVAVYQPCETLMTAAEMIIARDLQQLRNCRETGEWHGYPQEITPCALPQYQMKQLENIV